LLTSIVPATASISPLLERKIEETSAGLQAAFARHLSSISEDNAIAIIEYIAAIKSEVNLSDNFGETLSKFYADSPDLIAISISKV
jgi:hypothetical protein